MMTIQQFGLFLRRYTPLRTSPGSLVIYSYTASVVIKFIFGCDFLQHFLTLYLMFCLGLLTVNFDVNGFLFLQFFKCVVDFL